MTVCWQTRDCPQEMHENCPHAVIDEYDMCPTKCSFAACYRDTNELTSDPALVFSADVDRDAARKQSCLYCAFFLKNGPRKNKQGSASIDEK
jgi:hypothetical protein